MSASRLCELKLNGLGHAYCLMTNHYHLRMETPDANLTKGIRQPNGVYTQRFNQVHGRCGHVFHGRYKTIIVQKEAYLKELARYIAVKPMRAGMVVRTDDWP
ncbi:transposase [uncultured Thiohalocapsa sp.]|uniref:transposase n=1 Tax=uncultured Thiohalocapsa sp. TaxID=768990 RepID=UPI00345B1EAA